jgi:hypothetical protein
MSVLTPLFVSFPSRYRERMAAQELGPAPPYIAPPSVSTGSTVDTEQGSVASSGSRFQPDMGESPGILPPGPGIIAQDGLGLPSAPPLLGANAGHGPSFPFPVLAESYSTLATRAVEETSPGRWKRPQVCALLANDLCWGTMVVTHAAVPSPSSHLWLLCAPARHHLRTRLLHARRGEARPSQQSPLQSQIRGTSSRPCDDLNRVPCFASRLAVRYHRRRAHKAPW